MKIPLVLVKQKIITFQGKKEEHNIIQISSLKEKIMLLNIINVTYINLLG